jgi:hypothetical protein
MRRWQRERSRSSRDANEPTRTIDANGSIDV